MEVANVEKNLFTTVQWPFSVCSTRTLSFFRVLCKQSFCFWYKHFQAHKNGANVFILDNYFVLKKGLKFLTCQLKLIYVWRLNTFYINYKTRWHFRIIFTNKKFMSSVHKSRFDLISCWGIILLSFANNLCVWT